MTLRTAYSIWSARSSSSADALHASRVLRAILNRIDLPGTTISTSSGPMTNTPSSSLLQSYESVPTVSDDSIQPSMPLGGIDTYATDDTLFGNGMDVAMPNFDDILANIDEFDWVRAVLLSLSSSLCLSLLSSPSCNPC